MNQRRGKTHAAAMNDSGGIKLRELIMFAKEAQEALELEGHKDSAFYFGQLKDYLQENPSKGLTKDPAYRILGL